MRSIEEDLQAAVDYHGHLCSGQLLGVRMARYAARLLDIEDPRAERDLIVYVENDRCLADAIGATTGCKIGKRTLKWMDYGKSAATFLNSRTGEAVRLYRERKIYPPEGEDLVAFYGRVPDEELFVARRVKVDCRPEDLPGKPLFASTCARCGEQMIDGRQVEVEGETLCKPCAEGGYYVLLEEKTE